MVQWVTRALLNEAKLGVLYCPQSYISYLAKGGSKSHRAAHTLKMLSAIGSIGRRKFPCRILKSLRRPIAWSTWIWTLAMAWVDLTGSLESCFPEKKKTECKYSKFQLEKLQIVNGWFLGKENSEQTYSKFVVSFVITAPTTQTVCLEPQPV